MQISSLRRSKTMVRRDFDACGWQVRLIGVCPPEFLHDLQLDLLDFGESLPTAA